MALLGNLIWFVFLGGFVLGLSWVFLGCLFYLTVIGIPFGRACFRIASFAFFPFGKDIVDEGLLGEARTTGTALANLLWFVFAGLWLALAHVGAALVSIASCLLIVPIFLGAPVWALAHINLARVSLAPLGKRVVSKRDAAALRQRRF